MQSVFLARCGSALAHLLLTGEPPLNSPLVYSRLTYGELEARVHTTTLALRSLGLKPLDILVYYGPTSTASLVLLLATSAIGAIWSSAAADFGSVGVLERFEQFLPAEKGKEGSDERQKGNLWGIVGVESVRYNGKVLSQRQKLASVVDGLEKVREEKGLGAKKLEVVLCDYLGEGLGEKSVQEGWRTWEDLMEVGEKEKSKAGSGGKIDFHQADFDHPLWVLFSSGTTGKVSPRLVMSRDLR